MKNSRGMALVIVILILPLLLGIGLTFLSLAMTEATIAKNERHLARAFNVADGGAEHGRRQLIGSDIDTILSGGGALLTQSLAGGTYSVSIENNLTAYKSFGADAGGANDDTDGLVWITSTGNYRGLLQTVKTLVRVPNIPNFPGALGVLDGDDAANPTGFGFDGNSFTITGNDTVSAAPACGTTGAAHEGVTVESAPALSEINTEIDTGQEDNVTGASGNESTAQDNSLTLADVQALRDTLVLQATVTLSGNVSADVGSPTAPVIAYASDHLTLDGNGTGYGVLIVDRKLTVVGNYTWEGLVLVVGQGEISLAGTGATLLGAVIAVNTGAYSGNSGETRFDIAGNATVAYSTQALCRATSTLKTEVLAWIQK